MSTTKILLKSSDGQSFEVDKAVALQSELISNLVEDLDDTNEGIPLTNVSDNILALVIEYCNKKHAEVSSTSSSSSEDRKKWDADFVSRLDQSTIFDLILASNYLNIPSLLDLTCQTIADMIAACKDADEIRAKFEIVKDLTPEDEEKIRQENQWSFQ